LASTIAATGAGQSNKEVGNDGGIDAQDNTFADSAYRTLLYAISTRWRHTGV